MAIKGEMIDVTKLQDYELKNGWEILFLEKDSVSSEIHPILVLFKDDTGAISFNRCTDDGFSGSDKNPSEFDLVLKNKVKEQPQETKKRKVVQISAGDESSIYALCDDGKIYCIGAVGLTDWAELPEIPQD